VEHLTDDEAIERAKQGDAEAFRELIHRHQAYVFTLILQFVDNRQSAEDLAQEVFTKLHRMLPGFRGDAQFTTWLYRLAINAVNDHRRQMKRRPLHRMLDKVQGWLADPKPGPDRRLLEKEDAALRWKLIDELPEKYKLVVVLYHLREFSYQQIAAMTGLSVRTIETRLYRSKALLRERLLEVNGNEYETTVRRSKRSAHDEVSG